jgi:hypothetical protein
MAVAGFSPAEPTITHEPNMLVVSGSKSGEDNAQYLHRGLPGRAGLSHMAAGDLQHLSPRERERRIWLSRTVC